MYELVMINVLTGESESSWHQTRDGAELAMRLVQLASTMHDKYVFIR